MASEIVASDGRREMNGLVNHKQAIIWVADDLWSGMVLLACLLTICINP